MIWPGSGSTDRLYRANVAAQFNYAILRQGSAGEGVFLVSVAAPHLTGQTGDKTTELRTAAAAKLSSAQKAEIDQQVKDWRPVEGTT